MSAPSTSKPSALAPAPLTQSYRYELDPTPEQANLLRSHIGGSRFAYNALLGLVKNNWDENRTRKEAGEVLTAKSVCSIWRVRQAPRPTPSSRGLFK